MELHQKGSAPAACAACLFIVVRKYSFSDLIFSENLFCQIVFCQNIFIVTTIGFKFYVYILGFTFGVFSFLVFSFAFLVFCCFKRCF